MVSVWFIWSKWLAWNHSYEKKRTAKSPISHFSTNTSWLFAATLLSQVIVKKSYVRAVGSWRLRHELHSYLLSTTSRCGAWPGIVLPGKCPPLLLLCRFPRECFIACRTISSVYLVGLVTCCWLRRAFEGHLKEKGAVCAATNIVLRQHLSAAYSKLDERKGNRICIAGLTDKLRS